MIRMEVWGGGFLNESPRVALQVRNWCRHVRWWPGQQSNCPYCHYMVSSGSMCRVIWTLDTVIDTSCPHPNLRTPHRAGRRETREERHSAPCYMVSAVTSCGKVTISLYLCFKWLTGISTEFDDFLTYNNSFLSIFWREDNIFWCEFMVC